MSFPIVFIHKGYSDYLEYSLRQAKHTNPDTEIILLGDEANNKFPFVTHVNIKDYFKSASEFAKVYKHYSTNPYNYELFCFQRWMILEEYLQDTKYSEVFVCDSDILFYANVTKVLKANFKDIDVGLIGCSAGLSFWKIIYLKKLINLIFDSYNKRINEKKNRWKNIIKNRQLGGISDMTLIEEFYNKYNSKLKIYDFLIVENHSYFDANINISSFNYEREYEFKYGKKQFTWTNNTPFCFNHILNKNIKFNCIHFQGPAKYLMSRFYRGNNFHSKFLLDCKFKFLNLLAFWYMFLKIRYRFSFFFDWLQKEKKTNKK